LVWITEPLKKRAFTAKADDFLSSELFVIELFLVRHLYFPSGLTLIAGASNERDSLGKVT